MKYIFTYTVLHILNIIILCLVLFLVYIQFIAEYKEGFENTKKYTFIHVPKTGGSALNKVLEKYKKDFDLYSNHFHNMVATKYNRPVLCIREPVDRFVSLYKYWRQYITDAVPNIDTSVKHFIHLLKNESKYLLIHPIISEYHYFQQANYIDSSVYPYAVIMTYDKYNMEKKTNNLLDYLNITEYMVSLPVQNVSKETDVYLDNEDLEFIRYKYKDDFKLWYEIQNHPEKFLKVL